MKEVKIGAKLGQMGKIGKVGCKTVARKGPLLLKRKLSIPPSSSSTHIEWYKKDQAYREGNQDSREKNWTWITICRPKIHSWNIIQYIYLEPNFGTIKLHNKMDCAKVYIFPSS